jgi:hypothetical protein
VIASVFPDVRDSSSASSRLLIVGESAAGDELRDGGPCG